MREDGGAGGGAPGPGPGTAAGGARKCPHCGAPVESFRARCPSCGGESRSGEVSAAVRDFAARVKKLDGENPAIRRGGPWPMVWALGFAVFMALYGGGFLSYGLKNLAGFGFTLCLVMIPLSLFFGKPRMTAREKEKKALVERFIAPNTREDLLEFFAFALAQLEDTDVISAVSLRIGALVSGEKKYRLLWDRVWKTKCRQTYVKARLAMSGDQETLRDITDMLRRAKAL